MRLNSGANMLRQLSLPVVFILLLTSSLAAQATLRGSVRDADNGQVLTGATVYLPTIQRGIDTDSFGLFRFNDLPPGRYPVEISYLGYQQLVMNEVLVSSGKEQVLDIILQEAATSLTAVTVKASRQPRSNASPNILNLSQEETLRFPATFNDPARLATAYAGVTGANDQANHLIIRGQSPLGMQWRLDGLEIVNPNHTANGGTFTDRPTLSGGGVNAISAQLLQEANFYLGAAPAALGNATTAQMDMRLRNGNNEQREYTIQAGLIGFDLAAEGPIRAGGSSYLVNYRYSFTGLLSDLGVSFGNEDIRFQDLSFKLHFPGQKGGAFSIFGLLGSSSNEFNQPTDTTEWETEKDLYNTIDFSSEMATVGASWTQPQGDNARWRAAAAWSGVRHQRLGIAPDLRNREWDELRQQKTSFQLSYRRKLLPFGSITLGVEGLYIDQSVEREFPFGSEGITGRSNGGLVVSPYIDWRYQIKRLSLNLGWRLSNWIDWLDESSYSEPRLALSYLLNKKNTVGADLSVSTQAPSPYELALQPRRSRLYSAYWNRQLSNSRKISIQLYQQNLTQITGNGAISAINQIEQILPETDATSEARTQGAELTVQQFATGGWWYVVGVSLFDARYQDEDGEWVKSRFAQDYATALTLGKEWSGTDRKQQVNRFGFNVALHYNGGLRAAPIDLVASDRNRTTVFDFSQGYTEQLPAYFRTDLRIYYQKNRANWNSMLSLDIQNVSGQQNAAYDYYDRFLGRVNRRFQLEFIPIINYRINF
ncbi:MAG: TonB-dependent receptor [Bacteroidota bacterium]